MAERSRPYHHGDRISLREYALDGFHLLLHVRRSVTVGIDHFPWTRRCEGRTCALGGLLMLLAALEKLSCELSSPFRRRRKRGRP